MPLPNAVAGAITVLVQARQIKRRATSALTVARVAGHATTRSSKWGPAWLIAGAAVTAANAPDDVSRSMRRSSQYLTAPMGSKARMPWWARLIVWLLVLIYPFWTMAQTAADLKVFPWAWLSPTYGQVFGYGDGPGYLSPEDVWKRIKPVGTTPPDGWAPNDTELRQAFATFDWSATCQQTTTVAPATQAQQVSGESWVAQTFSAFGDAMADELLDPENLWEYGEWFFSGAKTVVTLVTDAFLDHQDADAHHTVYATALAAYEAEIAATCACPTVPAGGTVTPTGSWDEYANGRIPLEVMSPLASAPAHRLRPDAAAAFDAMSRAYEAEWGRPIAITDSYRSYDRQVATKAAKGWLAATPGTSNHGWGVAVDLGGGIHRFGTPQHEWMADNAARFGWDLPDWASRGGSKPEPWHWEYTKEPDAAAGATLAACTPADRSLSA